MAFFDRLILNWKTTMAAVIPAIIIIGNWVGWTFINPNDIMIVVAGFYAVVLLFAKD